ncbi:MAG TPA: endonuclease/exonuclease/phosphatase family protein [Thermoanaerobaculia bacterium]|nr:endonuclease/exonuclease/phosphatase family protein [Thermoanaerobaculia bacterium]
MHRLPSICFALLLLLPSLAGAVEIFEIQGSGEASPLAGARVETEGVVTAVGPAGFFMQTPVARADADEATSNGIYVFTGSVPAVRAGDVVRVTATVAEFFGLTELTTPTITVTSSNSAVPAAAMLQPGDATLERFEGMLVQVSNGTAAAGTDRFGAVKAVASAVRPFREPGIEAPGLPGLPVWDGNQEIFEVQTDAFGAARPAVVGGARIHVAEGPLGYSFGSYEIWPLRFEFTNLAFPRPVRPAQSNELTIGSQNLERFSANDPRFEAVSKHIREMLRAPDVVAVQEVDTLGTLQALADRIRSDDATISYRARLVEGNDPGGIDVGFLVRDRVELLSVEAWGREDTWIAPGATAPAPLHDRPPLVLRAIAGGVPFTVIAVHLRSLIDIENERVRAKRHEQALRLSRYIDSLQDADPQARIAVVGDFNAYEFTDGYVDVLGQLTGSPDPAGALQPASDEIEPNLTNHVSRLPATERYSYLFEGSAQVLDHALTSAAWTQNVQGLEYARTNADAPDSANAISDHDGLVLYIRIAAAPTRRRAIGR